MMGKTTITGRDASESKGQSGSYSVQDRGLGRDLLDPAEVGRIGRTECLVIIVGLPPSAVGKSTINGTRGIGIFQTVEKFRYLILPKQQPFLTSISSTLYPVLKR